MTLFKTTSLDKRRGRGAMWEEEGETLDAGLVPGSISINAILKRSQDEG